MTSTSTRTFTRTNTAVYLTDVVMGAIADILGQLRIDLTTLYRDWSQDEAAIRTWIEEGSLKEVVLQCRQPNGTVAPIIEFPVTYRADGIGDASFTADRASLARYRAKLSTVPAGTTYNIVCTFSAAHATMPGWSPTTRASTVGLMSMRFGTLGSAPHASVDLRYLH